MQTPRDSQNPVFSSLLKEAFLLFDKDHSQTIDPVELHDIIQVLGLDISLNRTKAIICRLKHLPASDIVNDEKLRVSIDNFLDLLKCNELLEGARDLREAFSVLDHDRSGTVDVSELKALFTTLHSELRVGQLDVILGDLDGLVETKLDYNQFVSILWQADG